jgi:hypothetical protein
MALGLIYNPDEMETFYLIQKTKSNGRFLYKGNTSIYASIPDGRVVHLNKNIEFLLREAAWSDWEWHILCGNLKWSHSCEDT